MKFADAYVIVSFLISLGECLLNLSIKKAKALLDRLKKGNQ